MKRYECGELRVAVSSILLRTLLAGIGIVQNGD